MQSAALRWAVAFDVAVGEPPAAAHPTVWMGRGLGRARAAHARRAPRGRGASFAAGALTLGAGAFAAWSVARLVERAVEGAPGLPRGARDAAAGALLKPALSVRALVAAGAEVERALLAGRLVEARRLLGWHLVSRDTARLSAPAVAGAAIESLAENLCDAFVAPALYHAAGGLAGAYLYRLVNTADAMLGYRTPELEWFGKAAARADDVLNLAPARLSALLVALAAPAGGGSTRAAVQTAAADARRTPSPNAGWPMAAMAGALGVRLDKRAPDGSPVYVLNAGARTPGAADVRRARRVVAAAAALGATILSLVARGPAGGRAA